jgi:hypothetical protein
MSHRWLIWEDPAYSNWPFLGTRAQMIKTLLYHLVIPSKYKHRNHVYSLTFRRFLAQISEWVIAEQLGKIFELQTHYFWAEELESWRYTKNQANTSSFKKIPGLHNFRFRDLTDQLTKWVIDDSFWTGVRIDGDFFSIEWVVLGSLEKVSARIRRFERWSRGRKHWLGPKITRGQKKFLPEAQVFEIFFSQSKWFQVLWLEW